MKIELTFLTACVSLVILFVTAAFFGKPYMLIAADSGILLIMIVRMSLGEIEGKKEKYFLLSILVLTGVSLALWFGRFLTESVKMFL